MYFYTHLLLMRRCILVLIYYGNRCFYIICQSTIIVSLIHIPKRAQMYTCNNNLHSFTIVI